MTDPQERAAKWLRASRNTETQEALAADIERVTGWHITRDRYSKYESGFLPMGPTVLARFVDYWATKGKPGPFDPAPAPVTEAGEDTPPSPAAYLEILKTQSDRLDRQAETIDRLTSLVETLVARTTQPPPNAAWVADALQQLRETALQHPTGDPTPNAPGSAHPGTSETEPAHGAAAQP